MNDFAHSYHPRDDSLNARVEALRVAMSEHNNAQENLTANPSNRIGSTEEIQYALSVSKNTLKEAINALSAEDLKQAQEQSLLSQNELVNAHSLTRMTEMTNKRGQDSQAKDSHSRKL